MAEGEGEGDGSVSSMGVGVGVGESDGSSGEGVKVDEVGVDEFVSGSGVDNGEGDADLLLAGAVDSAPVSSTVTPLNSLALGDEVTSALRNRPLRCSRVGSSGDVGSTDAGAPLSLTCGEGEGDSSFPALGDAEGDASCDGRLETHNSGMATRSASDGAFVDVSDSEARAAWVVVGTERASATAIVTALTAGMREARR